jgi:hypothetical protein
MKFNSKSLKLAVLLLVIYVSAPYAQKPTPPPHLQMQLILVFESQPAEYIFVINAAAFRSVDSLKRFVAGLPEDTVVEWAPGCDVMGDEPLLSSAKDMEDFKQFCKKEKIRFVLKPSG